MTVVLSCLPCLLLDDTTIYSLISSVLGFLKNLGVLDVRVDQLALPLRVLFGS